MIRFINDFLVKRNYNRMLKLVDESQTGNRTEEVFWMRRAQYCENLINNEKKLTTNGIKALCLIIAESEIQAELCRAEKKNEYLKKFADYSGYETFAPIDDFSFGQKFKFLNNKSEIIVTNNDKDIVFETSYWSPGKHYEFEEDGKEYTIAIVTEPIKRININIETEYHSENTEIELKKIESE